MSSGVVNSIEPFAEDGEWKGYLTKLSKEFDAGVTTLNTEVESALASLTKDPSNPELLAQYQSRLAEYTLYRTAQANVVKTLKEVAQNTISKL